MQSKKRRLMKRKLIVRRCSSTIALGPQEIGRGMSRKASIRMLKLRANSISAKKRNTQLFIQGQQQATIPKARHDSINLSQSQKKPKKKKKVEIKNMPITPEGLNSKRKLANVKDINSKNCKKSLMKASK